MKWIVLKKLGTKLLEWCSTFRFLRRMCLCSDCFGCKHVDCLATTSRNSWGHLFWQNFASACASLLLLYLEIVTLPAILSMLYYKNLTKLFLICIVNKSAKWLIETGLFCKGPTLYEFQSTTTKNKSLHLRRADYVYFVRLYISVLFAYIFIDSYVFVFMCVCVCQQTVEGSNDMIHKQYNTEICDISVNVQPGLDRAVGSVI